MLKVTYPSKKVYKGPFLIEEEKYIELDGIITSIKEELLDNRSELIELEVNELLQYYEPDKRNQNRGILEAKAKKEYDTIDIKTSVSFKEPKNISSVDFKTITFDERVKNDLATEFSLTLKYGLIQVKLEYQNHFDDDEIVLSVKPLNNNYTKEIFYSLDKWIKQVEPLFLVRYWIKLKNSLFYIAMFFLIVLFVLLGLTQLSSNNISKDKATQLLKDGLSNEEMSQAVELLLRQEFGINDGFYSLITINSFITYLLPILFFSLLIYFCPKTTFGFGIGNKKIKIMKKWIRLITVLIPTGILLPFIINKLSN